jgi:acetyltransferase-like isoleucine patch superfamily enzyme
MYPIEWFVALPWPPPARAFWLRRLGATVGRKAVIHRCHFMNLEVVGFRNLTVGEAAHIGPECLLDLTEPVTIGPRASISPRVTLLTHADPGEGALKHRYPRQTGAIQIGADTWVGAGSTILHGVSIGSSAVVGAGSLLRDDVPAQSVVAGVPARRVDEIIGD